MQRGSFHPQAGRRPLWTAQHPAGFAEHAETRRISSTLAANRSAAIANHRGRGRNQGRMSEAGPRTDVGRPPSRANLNWKHVVRGRAILFGQGFADCWYEIPGVPGLELSGDLRLRGRRGLRRFRYDDDRRPYNLARTVGGPESDVAMREGQVMIRRAVMSEARRRACRAGPR
jgi:hypothetical protein